MSLNSLNGYIFLTLNPQKSEVVQNLPKLRHLELSGYEPNDMWDAENNLIFLKYCPNSRDRCYHGMEVDTGASHVSFWD